ncbi:UDP-N-acetylmuramate dehydrogenase [Hyphobacterium sp. CCMP332]|nr:UDP-N-acetylmuramate dehydrogenase [Hyphobacterium sp. CCMP332]
MSLNNLNTNISLIDYNTFGIDVYAKEFIVVKEISQLIELYHEGYFQKKHLILGGGSNILLTDNFEGIVIKIDFKGKLIISEDEDSVLIEIGAGENWHDLVLHAIQNQWAGIENLSLIPGTVGAAPMQNIGAYGVEIKNVFEYLFAFEKESGQVVKFDLEACDFGYRSSVFKTVHKNKYIITRVCLRLKKNPKLNTNYGAIAETLKAMGIDNPGIQDISDAVIKIRSSKLPDPNEIGNAGSFFKNPVISIQEFQKLKEKHPEIPSYAIDQNSVKIPAGWLIENAGWKGKIYKNSGVHEKQALVLVNKGNASGNDVLELSQLILNDIKSKFGIQLEREVNII